MSLKTPKSPKAVLPRIRTCVKPLVLLALAALGAAPVHASADSDTFTILTYDSMVAQGGLGPEIFPRFEKLCGCKVRAISAGDTSQILNRLQIDADHPPVANVVLGLDEQLWSRAKNYLEGWGGWVPKRYRELSREIRVDDGFLPFDYGVFAFMVDEGTLQESGIQAPDSLVALTRPEFRRKVLLEDPRTSGPGLAFLLYTESALGAGAQAYWRQLSKQWLTLAPGWSSAYGLFLKREAPLVWSYTTSQAYHEEHPSKDADAKSKYRAILFSEGQPVQIEGAAWIKGANKSAQEKARAKLFLEFLLSPEVQNAIPLKNWMFPAVETTPLPKSFARLPKPAKKIRLASGTEAIERSLKDWDRSVH